MVCHTKQEIHAFGVEFHYEVSVSFIKCRYGASETPMRSSPCGASASIIIIIIIIIINFIFIVSGTMQNFLYVLLLK